MVATISPYFNSSAPATRFSGSTFASMPSWLSQDFGDHRRRARGNIDVDALAVQVLELSDILASEDGNFLIVKLDAANGMHSSAR